MSRWPLRAAVLAALAGIVMLALWFAAYWPPSRWTVLSRDQLAEKGRQVTQHFGVNTADWKVYEIATIANGLARYKVEHPLDTSPLSVRLTFVAKQGGQAAEVGFDSTGKWTYWRAPKKNYKPAQNFDSALAAATEAFQFMAGKQASNYKNPSRSMGDDASSYDYEWKLTQASNLELRERIKVSTKDGMVQRVDRKTYLASDDGDSNDNYGKDYWDILTGIFGLICILGVVAILSIYTLWLVRRAISHVFPIRVAAVFFSLLVIVALWGLPWEKMRSVNLDEHLPITGDLFLAAILLCFVSVGRVISEKARLKWLSLEQLCFLAPIAKPTGESLAAGVLFSPFLVAIPFLIAACGLFPHSWVLPHNAELLYSKSPLLDGLKLENYIDLLGFFGFGVPAIQRLLRSRWLQWLVIVPTGILFFSDQTRVVSGPLTAALTAGVLTFAVFWFVWAHFDVLAVVTLQLASGFVLGVLMLAQKGHWNWMLMALAVGGLLAAALWCYSRGEAVAAGDPRANVPTLVGFRAEREKLRAEFSVARRAQQDMLPHTPPTIPGYTIAASCTPSLEVGGDLYDFLKLQDGRIGIGVADVSGKGVPAALYMTLTKGLLASVTKGTSELPTVLEQVNRHLHSVTRKKVFVTMALGFLNTGKRVLECARAGHNPVVWRQTSQDLTTLVSPGGIGLGITAGKVFGMQLKVAEMALSEGDAVVFYSDGITEAMNSELEQFGEQRLMEAVQRTDNLNAADAHDRILNEVREFLAGVHPQDDMTLVVLRVGTAA